MWTKIDCHWSPAAVLQQSGIGRAHTYTNVTAASVPMDPFQPDVGGLDDEAFMQSLEGVHGQPASLEQEAALLPELPLATPSISQVLQ